VHFYSKLLATVLPVFYCKKKPKSNSVNKPSRWVKFLHSIFKPTLGLKQPRIFFRVCCRQKKDRRKEQKEREVVSTNPWRPCFCIRKERTRVLRGVQTGRALAFKNRRTGTEQNAVARALLWCLHPVKSLAACLCCLSL